MSKAAERSSKVNIARSPESKADKMSVGTLSTVVSVERNLLYADWRSEEDGYPSGISKLLRDKTLKQLGKYTQI